MLFIGLTLYERVVIGLATGVLVLADCFERNVLKFILTVGNDAPEHLSAFF